MSPGESARRRPSTSLHVLYLWLASYVARRRVSLCLIVAILAVDLALPWQGWSFTVRALLDEPCHQATGLICLGTITRFRGRPPDPRFGWAMLICSNAIDLDHLPLEFGSSVLTAGTPRPYTHALWVVVVLALAALAARYTFRHSGTSASTTIVWVLFGAACGVSDHFLRDIATAQMSLWWPFTDAPVQVPYWWYVAAIVFIALVPVPVLRQRRPRSVANLEVSVGNLPKSRLFTECSC
jgi:inner membrane protein